MRRIIALALVAAFAVPAAGADKAGPPDSVPVVAAKSPIWCNAHGLVSSAFDAARGDDGVHVTVATSGASVGLGVGCDMRHGRWTIGALARYELPDVGHSGLDGPGIWTGAVRGGYLLNESVLLYGLAGLSDSDIWTTRGRVLGLGFEVDLGNHLALIAEYGRTTHETWRNDDASHAVRLGLSYRFMGGVFGQ